MTAEIGREIEDLARWPGLDLTLPAYRTHHEPESFSERTVVRLSRFPLCLSGAGSASGEPFGGGSGGVGCAVQEAGQELEVGGVVVCAGSPGCRPSASSAGRSAA
jgi:hypothetical protein